MRRSLTKIGYPVIGRGAAAGFSTGGRGRGIGTPFQFTVDSTTANNNNNTEEADKSKYDDALPNGHGRGRGTPAFMPSFSSILNNDSKAHSQGRGRGGGGGFIPNNNTNTRGVPPPPPPKRNAKFLFTNEDEDDNSGVSADFPISSSSRRQEVLPNDIINFVGVGRGGNPTLSSPPPPQVPRPPPATTENRHLRPRHQQQQQQPPPKPHDSSVAASSDNNKSQSLSQEEKIQKAKSILLSRSSSSSSDHDGDNTAAAVGRGGVTRPPRGKRGGGGGRARPSSDGGGRGRGRRYDDSDDDDAESGLYIGDPAEEEKLANRLGPHVMNQLAQGFEEMSSRVLPSVLDDAYYDALETNLAIECEPEYLMEEFGTNPDIDDKPPISLRDALEKMKPFLMAYEGIKTHQEWEEIIEETMKTVPLMKEIVDFYSGPDRVTAKQQQGELERVAKTLPASAPASVKHFTDRAVLTLQSNPGWGFDKKCQFMDKLVMEVSKQYK